MIRFYYCGLSTLKVWYPNTTDSVKSPATLRTTYLETVGRNSNLLLNISPNTKGAGLIFN
jgi:alpha-L-fucosidase